MHLQNERKSLIKLFRVHWKMENIDANSKPKKKLENLINQ